MRKQAQIHDSRNTAGSAVSEHTAPQRANARQEGGEHYLQMPIQPWDVIDTWPLEQRVGFYRGSALAYLMRLGSKDAGAQEARKAMHYCQKLAEVLSDAPS